MRPSKIKTHFTPKEIILASFFIFLFLLLRWNSYTTPFERDEGEYAYSAWILRQGIMPYENSFLQKPPMIIYTYAFGQLFNKAGLISPRILSSMFIFSTTVLLGLIAKKIFGKNAGWIAVLLVTPMLMLPLNTPFAANTEHFMLLPLIGLLAIYVFKSDSKSLFIWISAGILSSLTILFKPVGIPIIFYIYVVWIYELYKKDKKLLSLMGKLSISFFAAIAITIVVFSPFILTDTLDKLIESAFIYNLSYTSFEGFGIHNFFNFMGGRYIRYYWPLYLLIAYFLIKRSKKWWYWIGLLVASVVSVYFSPMGHYYILVMPFWALVGTGAIVSLGKLENIKKKLGKHYGLIITLAVVFILIYPFREQFGKTPNELNIWVYGRVNPFVDAQVVGEKVEEVTNPNDKIFVAGSEPEIYFYSKRVGSSRFVITYPLNITSKYQELYQNELVDNLKRSPPQAIVISNREHSGLWNEESPRIFIDYLDKIINIDYRLYGGYMWGSRGGYWLSSITEEEIKDSSLLLYIRESN